VRLIVGIVFLLLGVAGAIVFVDVSRLRTFVPRAELREDRKESLPSPTPLPLPKLTIDSLFSSDHTWVKSLPQDNTVTMVATGDVIPARSVNYKMVTGHGFRWPFEKTAEFLAAADITVINLETPLLAACPITVEGMVFCADAKAVEGLQFAGIDVATLGNNHVGNHYVNGVEETKNILKQSDILAVADAPVYKKVKNITFVFLSYNDIGQPEEGVPWADEVKIKQDIINVRDNADVVVVSYHWGVEYVTEPTERQIHLAHFAVDNGADVVLGNHPHWIQPVEFYKDKFIIYAHGNFVFDQEWSEETKLGVIGAYTFYNKALVDVEYVPIRIIDYGQPYFLDGDARFHILSRMKAASEQLAK